MEHKTRKAINFDLDTNRMRELGLYPDGYRKLGKSFYNYGFEHRQGSGYISLEKITSIDVQFVLKKVIRENAWLTQCTKKMDVTDIGKQHDLTSMIEGFAAEQGTDQLPPIKLQQSSNSENTKKELLSNDKEVIMQIRNSKMSAEFVRLYEGKYTGDKAVADKKLVGILSFFTNGNTEQIQRIFETSKLYEPAKGADFIGNTLSSENASRKALSKNNSQSKHNSDYHGH